MDPKILKIILISFGAVILLVLGRKKIAQEWVAFKENKKKWLYIKWKDWGEPILIAVILALFIRTFFVQAFKIPTSSMRPTFLEGDRIFVNKITYRFKDPQRGDIIVFKYPVDKKKDFVKRLIAFGGEKIEIKDGDVYVNGKLVTDPPAIKNFYYYNRDDWKWGKEGQVIDVPEDSYFVLGDNSAHSSDSRNWGFVPHKNLKGKAFLIWWPPNRIRMIKNA